MRVAGLDLVRGEQHLAAQLTFTVEAGTALAVVGANGSGKSTLLRCIAGLLPFEQGSVEVLGAEIPGSGDAPIAALSHYLGHQEAMKPALTVGENLRFWATMLRQEAGNAGAGEAASQGEDLTPVAALERFDLAHVVDTPAGYLSAGQRRRAALARLLVVSRPIWLLDEPTAALDAASVKKLTEVMAAHLNGGGLIVAATHDQLGIAVHELRLGEDAGP
ncbi:MULTISPECIES: heme ABC exporter ATP-binding protein CcmA [unclassified Beijerinckia]|uniref:heme ABC exporter ATP-binding protein CcmA n=1 Tax=unclassified Beijerinckia TaxID=2638183 RepID=UPI000B852312|nr:MULTISPECIES: heme ABC exporter ATP-binding protein CcmA [unclassified Beijerinckia]